GGAHGLSTPPRTDVAIVGGGLAGLALADGLQQAGIDWHLFEARERWGGRMQSLTVEGAAFDLGPSWFWSVQPRMLARAERLGCDVFEQYSDGDLLYEDDKANTHRGRGFASMAGSLRVDGGTQALTDALAARLPASRLHSSTPVRGVDRERGLRLEDGRDWPADYVVLTLPPRIAASLDFTPALTPEQVRALSRVPTWMAGHAKFVAVYETPFWRENGLSGDAMSHAGPLVEIHDASPGAGRPGALFGFYGVPAHIRRDNPEALAEATMAQLERLFGPAARDPRHTRLQDWAFEPATATADDRSPPTGHPEYGPLPEFESAWDGHLLLGGSETARTFGGYMEGALERAAELARCIGETQRETGA
ncbi:MAG: FAD-dependent oxidoreductase, partial [Halofilum sp. (in: g-proteobacteria)]